MLPVRLTSVDALLFASETVAIGSFRCPAGDPLYRDSGPTGSHLFVFPRTATFIRHDGGRRFLADPNTVTLYNRHQEYDRAKASEVDASDWYAVDGDTILDAVRAYDPRIEERPFRFTHAPASNALYARQRRLFERLASGECVDSLAVEESVLALLGAVLRSAYGRTPVRSPALRDAVEAARRLVNANIDRPVGLRQLARAVDCSPFALCRAFRTMTGMTITAYRHAIRMRAALELLQTADDLTTIALGLGYSSHSHFTLAFRRTFGMPPSEWRAVVAIGDGQF